MSAAVLLAAGCGREEIRVYRVPKEPQPMPEMPAEHPPPPAPRLTWRTPAGWEEVPAAGMRVASFRVTGPDGQPAEVSVIPLAGGGGDDLSNVNRWRSQVGLPAITAEELQQQAQPVTVAGQPAALYEAAGEATQILAVIYRREGTTWFFKMTGSPAGVAPQKTAFIEFVRGVRF